MKEKDKYAGFWERMLAHNIDILPLIGLFYLYSWWVPPSPFDYLFFTLAYISYHSGFEMTARHATPGKRWVKIYVADKNGKMPTFYQSIIRNVLKILSIIPFFGGIIMIFFNKRKQALHDYIGGTVVLFEE